MGFLSSNNNQGQHGPAMTQRPKLVRASIKEFEEELDNVREKYNYASGALTPSITKGLHSLHHQCWPGGRVLYDEHGFAVVVGRSSTSDIPVAIVGPHGFDSPQKLKEGHYLMLESVLEGSFPVDKLEEGSMRMIRVATRLGQLRVGGWKIVSEQRTLANGSQWRFGPYDKTLSKYIHSANIIDPLTGQLAYKLPDVLPARVKRKEKVLWQLIQDLERLPDSPILLVDLSANDNRLKALQEWSDDLKNDNYERLALARYPYLPIEKILELADSARSQPEKDPLKVIEASNDGNQGILSRLLN